MNRDSRLAIVTGSSAGIGLALTRTLLKEGWRVVGLSRRDAPVDATEYEHLTTDLSDAEELRTTVAPRLITVLREPGWQRVALVNNAAVVGALSWLCDIDPHELIRMFGVNAAAPMFLMGLVTEHSPATVPLRIVNVSSAAAHTPFPGLADYNATKAALRLAGRTLAAEFEHAGRTPRDAAVLSYEPGLVDTAMQDRARDTDPAEFPAHDAFREFADQGLLNPPAAVVGGIVAFLDSDPTEHFNERRFGDS
jgi:benzil reductase ((S)-benzoin forming)